MADVALVYQPAVEGALPLVQECVGLLEQRGLQATVVASSDLTGDSAPERLRLAVTFGGDGTILRTARWLAGAPVPVVGVQMGRLGFLAELQPAEIPDGLVPYVDGDYWVDRRAMLRAEIVAAAGSSGKAREPDLLSPSRDSPKKSSPHPNPLPEGEGASGRRGGLLALNEIVVGRGGSPRTVTVEVGLDGQVLHRFRCDGLIVATATGSTAYSFAAGGPVLAPDSRDVVVTPICPHLSALRALVLPGDQTVGIQVSSSQPALLTVDGQGDYPLEDREGVEARLSECETLFARRGTPAELYRRILAKLE